MPDPTTVDSRQPVIDLLSTSTTLSKDRQSYIAMMRFALWMMLWVTVAHFLVVFTPAYDVVAYSILDAPREVGQAARLGLIIMLPWSALIGWRRYLQGILIRNGRTRLIGIGTGVRVSMMFFSSSLLFAIADWPSLSIAAVALVLSVCTETVFVHVVSRSVIAEGVLLTSEPKGDPLSATKLLRFHLPLTATTMVMLLGSPLVTAALTRLPNAVTSMAAFQVATTMLFLFRTTTFAIPEVVITLSRERSGPDALARFCLGLGGLLTAILLLFAVSPLDDIVFGSMLGAEPQITRYASYILLLGSLMPLIGALQGYIRGMLTAHHLTVSRMVAILISIGVLAGVLLVGVNQRWSGLAIAPVSITISLVAELGVLAVAWHRGKLRVATRSAAG